MLSPLTVAVLDRRFAAEMTRYPEITASLFDRLSERSLRLATTQAISQLTRVDRRLKALFWHLAERWGRVSGDGVIVPLALTHRILGQLVGARRPTVSTALSELAEREELTRRPDGSWLLRGDPPDAESLARKPSPAGQAARPQDLMRPARRFEREHDERARGRDRDRAAARGARARPAARAARSAPRRAAKAPTPLSRGGRSGRATGMAMTTRSSSQGILSDDRAEAREQIIQMLTKAYWMEMETVINYVTNSVNPDGVRAQEIIESLREDIQEELGHAQQFATRIKELYGVVPSSVDFTPEQTYLAPPEHQTDIVHVIKGVIEAETGAIEHYNAIIEATEEVDPVTNDMVIAILRDEEGHRRLFEGFLREYEAEGLT